MNEKWYCGGWSAGDGLNKNLGIGLENERNFFIPALRKLTARSAVFESYVTQYELLNTEQIKPSEFVKKLGGLQKTSSVNGYFILGPLDFK